ncbi:hypothetical protein C7534_12190 [Pseudomonas sp. OV226]|jgi:hypothetical protein|nr:hypothetical protein C7534_12190 [Pseudomonas sp. OV226]
MNDEFELAEKLPPPRLTGLDNQVLKFSRHWYLSGVYLRCTSCGSGQKASEANLPFPHESSCLRADPQHYPWHDLARILHWVPSEDVVYI